MIIIPPDEAEEFLANEYIKLSEKQLERFKNAKKIYNKFRYEEMKQC